MIASIDELFGAFTPRKEALPIERATVAAFNNDGYPLLRFLGESVVSPKVYPKMRHYSDPRLGDRVLLIGNIIMGTWSN